MEGTIVVDIVYTKCDASYYIASSPGSILMLKLAGQIFLFLLQYQNRVWGRG